MSDSGVVAKVYLRLENGEYVAKLQATGREHEVYSARVVSTSASASAAVGRVGDRLQAVGTGAQAAAPASAVLNQTATAARQASQAVGAIPQQLQGIAAHFQATQAGLAGIAGQATATRAALGTAVPTAQALGAAAGTAGQLAASGLAQADKQAQNLGMSAKATAAAMRGVPAQITDIVVGLQGGQAPMTVLLQQGGQLRDVFGGTVPAVRALASTVVGMISPLTILLGAAGVLAYAYKAGAAEGDEFRHSIVMSGNAAGTTVGQLTDMSRAIAQVTGTQGAASAALAQMAGSGAVARENLQHFAQVAMGLDQHVGQAVNTTVGHLERLSKAPLQASLQLNEQYHYLTEAVYAQIKALDEQGRKEEAGAVAQRAYIAAFDARKNEIVANLGSIERGWNAVVGAAKKGWDAILGVGRQASTQQQLDETGAKIAKLREQLGKDDKAGFSETEGGAAVGVGANVAQARRRAELDMLVQQQAVLQESLRLEQRGAEAKAESARLVEARAEWDKVVTANLSKQAKEELEIKNIREKGKAAGKDAAEIDKQIAAYKEKAADKSAAGTRELERQKSLLAELAGLSSSFYRDWDSLNKQFKDRKLTAQQLVQEQEKLLAKQPSIKAAREAELKVMQAQHAVQQQIADEIAQAEVARTQTVYAGRQAVTDYARGVDEATRLLEVERQTVTGTASQRALAVELLRIELELERQLEAIRTNKGFTQADRDEQAQKARDAAAQARANATSRAELDHVRELRTELQRVTEQYEQGLTNAAMQGGKSLKEYVLGMLRTTSFRIALQPVTNLGAQALTAITGGSSGAGGVLSMVSNASGLYSAATGNGIIGNALNTVGGWLGLGGSAAATGLGLSAAAGAGTTLAATGTGLGLTGGLGAGYGLAAGGGLGITAGSAGAGAIGAGLGTSAAAGGTAAAGGITGALAAVPVWGWALAAVAALSSIFGKKSTPHLGAASSYSAATGLQSNTDIYAGLGFTDTRHYDTKVEGVTAPLATAIGKALDGVAQTFGKKVGYEVAVAFADDSSKDGAWGNLRIRRAGETVAEWGNTDGDKWAGITLSDGEDGVKEFMARAANTVKTLIADMGLPEWAKRIADSMPDNGTMDDLTAVLTAIQEYPEKILQTIGTSSQGLAQQFAEGLGQGNPQAVGEAFAQTVVGGIEGALVGNFSSQVTSIVTTGMVTPFVDAMMTGATTSEALAAMSIEQTLERAKAQAVAFKELWGNAEFHAALVEMRGVLSSTVAEAASAANYTPRYTASLQTATVATQAATDALRDYEARQKAIEDERKGLQDELDELTMTRVELLAKERAAIDASNQALWDQLQAARDAKEVSDQRKGLQDELNGLTDTAAQALQRQRDALHESNRALFDQVQALRLQQQLLAEVPALIDKYTTDAQRQASSYARIAADLGAAGIGVSAEALMGATKAQIAEAVLAIHAMGDTTDETRLALVRAASSLSDLKDAATSAANTAADAALSSLQRSIEAEKAAIAEAANARIEALRKEAEAQKAAQETASEALATAKRLAESLGRAVRTLRGQVESAAVQDLAAARRFIADAASAAASTGVLPDEDALARAIESVTADQQQRYGTYTDWEAAQLDQANQLAALGAVGEVQMTVAERQLAATKGQAVLLEEQIKATQDGATAATRALDDQLKAAQERLAVLRDSNAALKSIAASSAGFEAALARLAAAQSASAVGGGGGGGGGPGAPSGATGGSAVLNGPMGSQYSAATDTFYAGGSGLPYSGKALGAAAIDMVNAGQARELYDLAVANGVTAAMLGQWTGTSAADLNAWAREQGLPAFAQGTNYVPRDMLALVHEGEEIVPKRYNPAAQGGAWAPASTISRNMAARSGGAESALQAVVATLAGAVDRLASSNGRGLSSEDSNNLRRMRLVLEGAANGQFELGVKQS